ncbi:MAG: lysine 2,3-aminomutase [Halieaceae bacterium]|jgi:lysine 2,3-aminomutase
MAKSGKYVPSEQAQSYLDSVSNGKYSRGIITGLKKFMDGKAPEDMQSFYSASEIKTLVDLKDTDQDVESRMPVKVTRHYFELAKTSVPLQTLVKASPAETFDLDGSPDPGKQMNFSPVEGLIHKYELGLIYVASTCSAHCRFCYREELIAQKEVARPDGTMAPKGLAQIADIVAYVEEHNRLVAENGGTHPGSGREKLREILMSGGDPLVLGNKNIAAWLSALAEVGIESIRIGTKELAFYPDRFDSTFFDMLDKFHAIYPEVKLRFMVHFNHPDEFLKRDDSGNYIENPNGGLEWVESTKRAVHELGNRNWLNVDNQAPLIKGINGDPDALRTMQRELKRNGVENHYFFCGRDIIGHKAFNLPIEEAWRILNESQKGLSGVEAHARLSITHYKGKTEVAAVTSVPVPGLSGGENGVVILKLLRNAADAPDRGKIAILGRNPEAIWFDGYKDRVLFDEAGFFDDSDADQDAAETLRVVSSNA